jgi:phage baseplate assembly protein gpV
LPTKEVFMRKIIAVANVGLLALAVAVGTAAASTKSSTKTAAKAAAPAAHSVSGTIESFDASAKTLTVKGAKSTWTFSTASAQAWEGSKSIGVDELSSHTGAKVTVKYTDEGGQKSASSVRIAPAHVAKASSKSK